MSLIEHASQSCYNKATVAIYRSILVCFIPCDLITAVLHNARDFECNCYIVCSFELAVKLYEFEPVHHITTVCEDLYTLTPCCLQLTVVTYLIVSSYLCDLGTPGSRPHLYTSLFISHTLIVASRDTFSSSMTSSLHSLLYR